MGLSVERRTEGGIGGMVWLDPSGEGEVVTEMGGARQESLGRIRVCVRLELAGKRKAACSGGNARERPAGSHGWKTLAALCWGAWQNLL